MERHVCVHAHFYQPPRENPWLEEIELQDSAYPFHDWNERIAAECYAPNASSRILDSEGRIENIVNNYARISFNFGPTLLCWMAEKEPAAYRAILEADRESRERFSGHGSALAQAYNHMILPLANRRDKETQVRWGIRDFEFRFGRRPHGMWLPETAVDLETLEVVAAQGIAFTVLAPSQAHQVRRIRKGGWHDVLGARIDPTMPYRISLPSGRSMVLFFYDGPISRAVAFEGLLFNGEEFARRLLTGFPAARPRASRLVHVATDGESYGHHHKHGEMALSYALQLLESEGLARLTNYGAFLERYPPTHEVRIHEGSSWSCVHGIERWRSDCGCNSGGHAGWNQQWRAPLRAALDGLRDALAAPFEERGKRIFLDPWTARDDYIDVVLDRSRENVDRFLAEHALGPLSPEAGTTALKLLELERHAMLMYTSCGWFFDEISGIETVQVLEYAGRAIQLARDLFGENGIEARFLDMLAKAPSNLPEHGDGRGCYQKFVRPAAVDLVKVGSHFAVSSLFESDGERSRLFCFDVEREDYRLLSAGKARLALGRARIVSTITRESAAVDFGVLHLGDHNVSGGAREHRGTEAYESLVAEISKAFGGADLPEILRSVDRHFGAGTGSLKLLFRDAQRRILNMILEKTLENTRAAFRQVYEEHGPIMGFLADLGHPVPKALQAAAELALDSGLRRALKAEEPDPDLIRGLLREAARAGVPLDASGLAHTFGRTLARLAHRFGENPSDQALLQRLEVATALSRELPFEVILWEPQNVFFEMLRTELPILRRRAWDGDDAASDWVRRIASLGEKLSVRLPPE